MHKIASIIHRKPGLSVEEFQRYWLEVHGPMLAKLDFVKRYVQSHPLPQGYRKGDLPFDGLVELWFDAPDGFRRIPPEVIADGDKFIARGKGARMAVDVHVIKDGAIPPGAVKNIELIDRRGKPLAEFRRYWREVHGPIAAKIPTLRRYEQNHTTLASYDGGQQPAHDGLAITWFASTDDMRAGARTPEYAATRADEKNFLPPGDLPIIIAREHVIVA
jgi:uncharacterized protein (TIGR02118 family)